MDKIEKRTDNRKGESMRYISIEDFYQKADLCSRISRQQEIAYAKAMETDDLDARKKLIESYIPMVAGHIRHMKPHMQTLGLVMYCMQALEKAVDSFDFLQDSESFSHHLSWRLRDATAKYIVRNI